MGEQDAARHPARELASELTQNILIMQCSRMISSTQPDGTSSGSRASRGLSAGEAVPEPFFVTYAASAARAALAEFIASQGASIHGYIPQNTWLVYAPGAVVVHAVELGLAVSAVRRTVRWGFAHV